MAVQLGTCSTTKKSGHPCASQRPPNAYLQQVRIAPASEFRELTLTPTDPVAWEVGYSEPAAFRKTFQKLTAVTPSAYRQRFGTA